MPHVSRLCLRVHFITFELFVAEKVAWAESAKRKKTTAVMHAPLSSQLQQLSVFL